MRRLLVMAPLFVLIAAGSNCAEARDYRFDKNYDEMTSAELTAAKRYASEADIRPLVACADPGNMPLSNDDGQGVDNRIARLLAEKIGTTMSFFWRPYLERGLTRETFSNKECDILLGMPVGYEGILTTLPIYKTTYVFATRADRNIEIASLSDPVLADLKIGVYQHSAMREALVRHGVATRLDIKVIRHNTDLVPENQQWRQVQEVVDGRLDAVAVWGPFAGYANRVNGGVLDLQPANLMEDRTPLEFGLAIGMRRNDVVLKYALDAALLESADEIEAILKDYGIPLVSCSECAVQGDLPSHGSYQERFVEASQARYLEPLDRERVDLDVSQASADQIVDRERLEAWLEAGADLDAELGNAVLAGDLNRIRFLIDEGANADALNTQGYAPMHEAARYRDSETIALLAALGADIEVRDTDGWTPLMHAAFLNHVPSIEALAGAGANLEAKNDAGYTALSIAVGERRFLAAVALIEAGADVSTLLGPSDKTVLMIAATHRKADKRSRFVSEGMEPVDLVRRLIEAGADPNARTSGGLTPLMYAAAHDNSPVIGLLIQRGADATLESEEGKRAIDYARDNRAEAAEKSLELFEQLSAGTAGPGRG